MQETVHSWTIVPFGEGILIPTWMERSYHRSSPLDQTVVVKFICDDGRYAYYHPKTDLINDDKYEIDIRYFPHHENIEFYSECTGDRPLFVENIGTRTLYVQASCGIIKLDPNERKEVCKENSEDDAPPLAGGDLYPAGVAW